MLRTEISPAVVRQIDRLLAEGLAPEEISARLGVSRYVVEVIDGDQIGRGRTPGPGASQHRALRTWRDLDAGDLRRVQRMLASRWLTHDQIAREAGVSPNIVYDMAHGRRPVCLLRHMEVDKSQVFLEEPLRCRGCGGLIDIVPCRTCYTRLVTAIDEYLQENFLGIGKLTFRSWVFIDFMLEYLKRTRGAKAMQDFITLLSDELAAFISAADKREHLIARSERLFDEVVGPLDLPGPDRVVDPLLRAAIRPLVGRLYDEAVKKLEVHANAA